MSNAAAVMTIQLMEALGFHLLLLCRLQVAVGLMGVLARWALGVLGEGGGGLEDGRGCF